MGGHSKQFEIGAGTTAAAVLKELLSHAEIKEINGWALYRSYTDRPGKRETGRGMYPTRSLNRIPLPSKKIDTLKEAILF